MDLRRELLKATRDHALGHVEKHRMNVEVYLHNPAGIGEHPDILEAIEAEMMEMAKYQDVLEILDGYFAE
jgi:hypothetical protein